MHVNAEDHDMPELQQLAEQLGNVLLRRGWKVAVAESCTGGWVAKCLTDIAGSSAWFDRGFVTYSNAAKTDLLGVDPRLLEREGAVSEAVARAMAAGALSNSAAGAALAVTGIAGPDGGGPGKPVGEGGVGYSCIAEIRMIETIESGKPQTGFLKFGDRVRIEMRDADGLSIFGAIDHEVKQY